MHGMDRQTGKPLSRIGHLRQSIEDILGTPKVTRVMRRPYGTDGTDHIDAPINAETLINIYAATVEALDEWEPRLKLSQVSVIELEQGHATLDLVGMDTETKEVLKLEGIKV